LGKLHDSKEIFWKESSLKQPLPAIEGKKALKGQGHSYRNPLYFE
jgi:hypothetical protein